MKKYSEYKDSGVKWIGEIPKHWKVIRLRYLGTAQNGISKSGDYFGNGFPFVTYGDAYNNAFFDTASGLASSTKEDQILYSIEKGDILFTRTSETIDEIGFSSVCLKTIPQATFSGFLIRFRPSSKSLDIKFSSYYFRSKIHRNYFSKNMNIVIRASLGQTLLKSLPVLLPPLTEQTEMVSYLDAKVSKIDRYISTAEKKIAALDELKQVTIADAVTHGINPKAKMKDSGIPWIGMVPEHWEVNKIRSHFKERRVKVSDKDYQPLSVAKIGIVPQLDDACKTENGDNRKLVLSDDFVVNSRSDRKGSCGVSNIDGSVSLINIVLKPFNVEKRYVHYLLRCVSYIEEFYRNGRGIVADLWTTRYSEMRNIYIPIPPSSEQNAIVSYIDRKVAQIDKMKVAELSQIEKLKEYKQRLISDVVTGKVKVTND